MLPYFFLVQVHRYRNVQGLLIHRWADDRWRIMYVGLNNYVLCVKRFQSICQSGVSWFL